MKILLISLNRESEPFAAAPLGLACVAGSLEREGHELRLLDLLFSSDPDKDMHDALDGFKPELVGLSLRNIESSTEFLMPSYKVLVSAVREHTDAPVVIGGPGFSIMPRQVLEYLGMEYGIVGEGEAAAVSFAAAVSEGKDPSGIPGVCTLRGGEFSITAPERLSALGDYPAPAWRLVGNGGYDMVGVQSKRGCSFGCVYCTYPGLEGRRMRLKEPSAVADELSAAKDALGTDAFYFVDNVFNNPRSHAEAVCGELARRDMGIEWGCLASPLGLDAGLVKMMAKAGCVSVEIGADSLSDRALKGLGKSFGASDVAAAIRACKEACMMHMVFLILGGPGEDEDTLSESFEALEKLSPDKVFAVSGVRLYPGTPLAGMAVKQGVISPGEPLFEPAIYVGPAFGEGGGRLYGLVETFFAAHPDWIHYRADAVTRPARADKAGRPALTLMPWDEAAEHGFDAVLAAVPKLLRGVAGRAVRKKAAELAAQRGRQKVGASEISDAFISETPGPFKKKMLASLKETGLPAGKSDG